MGNKPSGNVQSQTTSSQPPSEPVTINWNDRVRTPTLLPVSELTPIQHYFISGNGTKEYPNLMLKNPHQNEQVIKVFMSGISFQGKSTLFKQLQGIDVNYVEGERLHNFSNHIADNIIFGLRELFSRLNKSRLGSLPPQYDELIAYINGLTTYQPTWKDLLGLPNETNPIDLYESLWAEPLMKQIYVHRNNYYNIPRLDYWIPKIHELTSEDNQLSAEYQLTALDYLSIRVRTTGIVETIFKLPNGLNISFFDTGGERNERKKWIHCFEHLSFNVFACSLADFNRVIYEDGETNSYTESIKIFSELINSRWFENVRHIVIFTHYDEFQRELQLANFCDYQTDYKGDPHDEDAIINYLIQRFADQRDDKHKGHHIDFLLMNCVDVNHYQHLIHKLHDEVVKSSLQESFV